MIMLTSHHERVCHAVDPSQDEIHGEGRREDQEGVQLSEHEAPDVGRVAEHESRARREAEHELHVGRRGIAERPDRGVEVPLQIDALEVARPAERSAALYRCPGSS